MKTRRMLKAVNITMALALAAAMSPLYADPEASTQSAINPVFQKLDTNHDDYVSRAEAAKLRNFSKAFNEADENGDGRLDRDEFLKAQATHDVIRAKAYVRDSVITAKVKAALVKARDVKAHDINVETDKGVVILSGFVDDAKQVQRAQEIAISIPGVKSVKATLVVKS